MSPVVEPSTADSPLPPPPLVAHPTLPLATDYLVSQGLPPNFALSPNVLSLMHWVKSLPQFQALAAAAVMNRYNMMQMEAAAATNNLHLNPNLPSSPMSSHVNANIVETPQMEDQFRHDNWDRGFTSTYDERMDVNEPLIDRQSQIGWSQSQNKVVKFRLCNFHFAYRLRRLHCRKWECG